MTRRKIIVNAMFWPTVAILALFALGLDLRFGPDFRLSSKVIDPEVAGFRPEDFRLEDYNSAQDLHFVLKSMFPVGTDRSYVEEILSKQSDLIHYKELNLRTVSSGRPVYVYQFKKPPFLRGNSFFCKGRPTSYFETLATYDESQKLVNFRLKGFCGLPLVHGNFGEEQHMENGNE